MGFFGEIFSPVRTFLRIFFKLKVVDEVSDRIDHTDALSEKDKADLKKAVDEAAEEVISDLEDKLGEEEKKPEGGSS
jgi:hypothetical protein